MANGFRRWILVLADYCGANSNIETEFFLILASLKHLLKRVGINSAHKINGNESGNCVNYLLFEENLLVIRVRFDMSYVIDFYLYIENSAFSAHWTGFVRSTSANLTITSIKTIQLTFF